MFLKPYLQRRPWERNSPLFLPLAPTHLYFPQHPQHQDTDRRLSFRVCGCLKLLSMQQQPTASLGGLHPTANPWRFQGALLSEPTHCPPHLYCYDTGPRQAHLLPELFIPLLASTLAPPESRIHTEARMTFKKHKSDHVMPLFKIFQRLPAHQRMNLKFLTTSSYMIWTLPASPCSFRPPSSPLPSHSPASPAFRFLKNIPNIPGSKARAQAVRSASNGLCMPDFSSRFQLKCHRGLRQALYLQKAHHPIIQHFQSIHHNVCLLVHLPNVLLLGNAHFMRVRSAPVWIPTREPNGPLTLYPAQNRGLVYMEGQVCSCLLPLEA